MREIRRKEKAIDEEEQLRILNRALYVTIAMCNNNIPYLVTLNFVLDNDQKCIYFHCAKKGKKIEILEKNNLIWGEAMLDFGYLEGECDHNYASVHFQSNVTFIEEFEEKKKALELLIEKFEKEPEKKNKEYLTEKSIINVKIGKINISYMSGKKNKKAVID
ncbi:MAG: pyridoxamine 5'-phosphate oxidase family protein [Candidatus Heimdallarchaeum aukensis]|uniref:Pyridoxamine 5'-phosphate oxidase family protein n=1 Tax=Candidatus Heimdallarchaeum aukensis TaxID=2876573 RepID=A0A9Y1BLR0_9ARCH|nr:MAG: pyridoxamine 5'-phosphate oxidase family protein [Candidatus Heimdallarchaeum aukensis]